MSSSFEVMSLAARVASAVAGHDEGHVSLTFIRSGSGECYAIMADMLCSGSELVRAIVQYSASSTVSNLASHV